MVQYLFNHFDAIVVLVHSSFEAIRLNIMTIVSVRW